MAKPRDEANLKVHPPFANAGRDVKLRAACVRVAAPSTREPKRPMLDADLKRGAMALEPGVLSPLGRSDGRRVAVEVHDVLRRAILSGRLQPGVVLSQVQVAQLLHVSRTPVREAMRMLQESGLVTGEPNFRSRVIGFDPEDIASLYMKRIVLESFGVGLTTQRMEPADVESLRAVVDALESDEAHSEFPLWQELHRRLHRLFVAHAGRPYEADLADLELRSERYQSAYKGQHLAGWWRRGETEHRAIFEAMASGDAAMATQLSARHLARTALELLAALAPDYNPDGVRESLRFAVTAGGAPQLAPAAASGRRKVA